MNDMENTDEIIRLVAKEAIKEFDKEQKEKKKRIKKIRNDIIKREII